jgi:hypothetical protein
MAYPYGQQPYPGSPPVPGYPAAPGYPSTRSYYFIRSQLNGLVFDIEGGSLSPGARVIMWSQKPGSNSDNQLWYDDFSTGTIRSKMHEFCLDFNGSCLVVMPYAYGNMNQQWERADPFIRMRMQPNRVLDIANGNASAGAHLIPWDRHGGTNQCFDFQFLSPPMPPPRQNFYIVSDLHGKVLDIKGGSGAAGAEVIVWPKKHDGSRNQQWFFDTQGIIRSALNEFALAANHPKDRVRMMPFQNGPHQQWRLIGNRIMKNQQECLDIAGNNQNDGAEVISFGYKGSANQHWHIEYV